MSRLLCKNIFLVIMICFFCNFFVVDAFSKDYNYWNKYNNYSKEIIYSQDDINEINKKNIKESPYLYDVLSLKAIDYGVIAKRTVMKEKPVSILINSDKFNDEKALTALFPWDEVAIHKYNKDKTWAKVTCLDYKGWIKVSDIMIVPKKTIISLKNNDFITITARQVVLDNKILLDMGTYCPLVSEKKTKYIVKMPVAGNVNKTYLVAIDKSNAVKKYLDYSKENVVKQALKFRGEPYGWGHSNSTRDCSGFIRDLYRCFGINIARDTSTASRDIVGRLEKTNKLTEKLLKTKVAGGTLLYMNGHVMLYLGVDENDIPYIIHQFGSMVVNGKVVNFNRNDITKASAITSSGKSFLEYVHTIIDMTKLK